jgi:hypothetical protein
MDPNDLRADVAKLALPLLVERLGGMVEITEAEQQAFADRHGGLRSVGVQVERTANGLRLTVVHTEQPPPN